MDARAGRLHEHGASPVVEDVRLGEAQEGFVVVDMAFAGVNPVDRYQVIGRVAADLPLPRTLGVEGAGVVAEGGEGAGRRVFVNKSALATPGDGLWATKVFVRSDRTIPVPPGVELEVAAAMGVAGATAWRVVHELAEARAEDRVLVLGASGGVGSVIVSIAARLGCEVMGQTGSEEKSRFIIERGATRVVVAEAENLSDAVGNFRPTVVFDPLGDGFTTAALELLEPHGRHVIFGTSAGGEAKVGLQSLYRKGLRMAGYGGLIEPEERILTAVREALEACGRGEFEIVVGSVVPLDEVEKALADLGGRRVEGKVVLDLGH